MSHVTTSLATCVATTVAPSDFDTEAIWKTVSASTESSDPSVFTPKPSANTVLSPWTTATAIPGTPLSSSIVWARLGSSAKASSKPPGGARSASSEGIAPVTISDWAGSEQADVPTATNATATAAAKLGTSRCLRCTPLLALTGRVALATADDTNLPRAARWDMSTFTGMVPLGR